MITANDLKNIDRFLANQERVINQPESHKKMLQELRLKIAEELDKIKIKVKKHE